MEYFRFDLMSVGGHRMFGINSLAWIPATEVNIDRLIMKINFINLLNNYERIHLFQECVLIRNFIEPKFIWNFRSRWWMIWLNSISFSSSHNWQSPTYILTREFILRVNFLTMFTLEFLIYRKNNNSIEDTKAPTWRGKIESMLSWQESHSFEWNFK